MAKKKPKKKPKKATKKKQDPEPLEDKKSSTEGLGKRGRTPEEQEKAIKTIMELLELHESRQLDGVMPTDDDW